MKGWWVSWCCWCRPGVPKEDSVNKPETRTRGKESAGSMCNKRRTRQTAAWRKEEPKETQRAESGATHGFHLKTASQSSWLTALKTCSNSHPSKWTGGTVRGKELPTGRILNGPSPGRSWNVLECRAEPGWTSCSSSLAVLPATQRGENSKIEPFFKPFKT